MSAVQGVLLKRPEDRLKARQLARDAAMLGYHHAANVHYTQGPERWSGIDELKRAIRGQYPLHADCSAYVTWALWTATRAWHLPDFVNGEGWDGGFTGTMIDHGLDIGDRPGRFLLADVPIYGSSRSNTKHTAILVGTRNGVPMVVSFGSDAGPFLLPYNYRSDLVAVKRFIR